MIATLFFTVRVGRAISRDPYDTGTERGRYTSTGSLKTAGRAYGLGYVSATRIMPATGGADA